MNSNNKLRSPGELSFSEKVRVRGVVFVSVFEIPSDLT